MKHFITTLIVFFSVLNITTSAQSVNYSILTDNPKAYNKVCLMLDPFYAEAYNDNAQLGWGARGEATFLNHIETRFGFRKAYSDIIAHEQNIGYLPMPKGGLKLGTSFEVGGTFYFFSKTKEKQLRVGLSSRTVGNYTYNKFVMVPAHKQIKIGARGGFYASFDNFEVKYGKFFGVNKSNTRDTLKFGDYTNSTDGFDTYSARSVQRSVVLYGGISYRTITNLLIQTDGFNKKGNRKIWDVYFDLMMAPIINYKDVVTKTKTWEVESNDGVKQRLGYRFGCAFRSSSAFGYTAKIEFGSKPGIAKGGFINLGMGISIPFSIKAIEQKSE